MALRRRLFLLSLAASGVAALTLAPAGFAATDCTPLPGEPVGNGWTLRVCLTVPDSGGTVAGSFPTITANPTIEGGTGSRPRIQRMIFTLSDQGDPENRLLTDFTRDGNGNYSFVFPRRSHQGGNVTFGVRAMMTGSGTDTGPLASLNLSFSGSEEPLGGLPFTPRPGRMPSGSRPFIVAAVGDGAGGEASAVRVLNLIRSWNPNLFLYTGDVYNYGTQAEYYNHYGLPGRLWGTLRGLTNPTIGNHDSFYRKGFGYFNYWGIPQNAPSSHYYSVDARRGWHIVNLDSTRSYLGPNGGLPAADAQLAFLRSDLDANRTGCALVFYHHPRYDIGEEFDRPEDVNRLSPIWSALANRGADIVLDGHDHNYQHWQRLSSSGNPRRNGTAEFVLGAGGHGIQQFVRQDSRVLKGIDTEGSFGALRLVLNRRGAEFRYITVGGRVRDAGVIPCSDARPTTRDRTRPTRPPHLRAHGRPGSILLRWYASTDVAGVGVTKYRIFRNGRLVGTTKIQEFVDRNARRGRSHRYYVKAVDWPGNVSLRSNVDRARVQ
jgi:calcineurin-like phosphoesterase family protein